MFHACSPHLPARASPAAVPCAPRSLGPTCGLTSPSPHRWRSTRSTSPSSPWPPAASRRRWRGRSSSAQVRSARRASTPCPPPSDPARRVHVLRATGCPCNGALTVALTVARAGAAGLAVVKAVFSPLIFWLYLFGTTVGGLYSVPPFQASRATLRPPFPPPPLPCAASAPAPWPRRRGVRRAAWCANSSGSHRRSSHTYYARTAHRACPLTVQLKRFPLAAGLTIATCRGFLLNFGVYYATREARRSPRHSPPSHPLCTPRTPRTLRTPPTPRTSPTPPTPSRGRRWG